MSGENEKTGLLGFVMWCVMLFMQTVMVNIFIIGMYWGTTYARMFLNK